MRCGDCPFIQHMPHARQGAWVGCRLTSRCMSKTDECRIPDEVESIRVALNEAHEKEGERNE